MDRCDVARPANDQRDAVELALHDLEVQQRRLAHQAGSNRDLRKHFSRIEEFAFTRRFGAAPREFDGAIRRQKTDEFAPFEFGFGCARELELCIGSEACN